MGPRLKAAAKTDTRLFRALYGALLRLESADEVRRFLDDLCTPNELAALADRWRVARLVERGEPYRVIYEKTGVSTATVTRVARALGHGAGGYRLVLERLAAKEEEV